MEEKTTTTFFQRFYLKTDTKPTDLQTMTMLLLLLLLLPVVVVVVVHSTAQMCCLRVLYTKGQLRVREKEREWESGRRVCACGVYNAKVTVVEILSWKREWTNTLV